MPYIKRVVTVSLSTCTTTARSSKLFRHVAQFEFAATWHFHSSLRVEKVRQKDDREHRRDLQPRAESEVVEELVAPRPHHLIMIA